MLLGTVPVLDARGNLDNVAGREALRCLALFLIPARAVNTDDRLASRDGCARNCGSPART